MARINTIPKRIPAPIPSFVPNGRELNEEGEDGGELETFVGVGWIVDVRIIDDSVVTWGSLVDVEISVKVTII